MGFASSGISAGIPQWLVSVDSATRGGALTGRKVEARGLLYRDGTYADLNLTSLKPVAADCTK